MNLIKITAVLGLSLVSLQGFASNVICRTNTTAENASYDIATYYRHSTAKVSAPSVTFNAAQSTYTICVTDDSTN